MGQQSEILGKMGIQIIPEEWTTPLSPLNIFIKNNGDSPETSKLLFNNSTCGMYSSVKRF
jgi:hypothetical protein